MKLFYSFLFITGVFLQTVSCPSAESQIIVNGRALSEEQIAYLASLYGAPAPGNYWYDAQSGLYGFTGQGAFGFLQAGLDFGPLSRNASNGNTGILVNGRDLTMPEANSLNQLLGGYLEAGSYWLNAKGDFGAQGYQPVANIYANLQAMNAGSSGNQGWGNQSGQDNFWSSGASNSAGNESGGTGYVNVDGTIVSYGD
jgi:hypothetical protein